ncbi:MAG TPA: 4Fe-4S dicluster domain-containing protein [candidate division Zixibacteria bacterium]|nr:4Fe-4S dicluster domain-containing protein [candidate division Zixibacteria bacterium]
MPEPKRQIAFVIDLNKCMGCHTCTIACKTLWTNDKGMDHMWWMKVNTMPGRGYPRDWEAMGGGYNGDGTVKLGRRPEEADYGKPMQFNYEEVFYGGRGSEVHLAPREKPEWGPNWEEDIASGEYPNAYFFYMPRMCNHCGRPACADACPHGAIVKREADGVVLVADESKCGSCADPVCMKGCPYKEVYLNPVRGVAQKCDACVSRMEREVAPACVRQCPGRCIWVGFLDDTGGPVHKLVKEWKVALPLHAEFGTRPNVYYVPPLAPPRLDPDGNVDPSQPRIPAGYLRKLFGSELDAALDRLKAELEKKRKKEESELMDILIARRWQELLGPFPRDPSEVQA